jgi:hypothetical protein
MRNGVCLPGACPKRAGPRTGGIVPFQPRSPGKQRKEDDLAAVQHGAHLRRILLAGLISGDDLDFVG